MENIPNFKKNIVKFCVISFFTYQSFAQRFPTLKVLFTVSKKIGVADLMYENDFA
jgi:hypothetical protein